MTVFLALGVFGVDATADLPFDIDTFFSGVGLPVLEAPFVTFLCADAGISTMTCVDVEGVRVCLVDLGVDSLTLGVVGSSSKNALDDCWDLLTRLYSAKLVRRDSPQQRQALLFTTCP